MLGKHPCTLELQFTSSTTVRLFATPERSYLIVSTQAEGLRSSLRELEGLLQDYSSLMNRSTERALDTVIKFGVVFAEVSSPQWQPARY
jgi:hypothetical protein